MVDKQTQELVCSNHGPVRTDPRLVHPTHGIVHATHELRWQCRQIHQELVQHEESLFAEWLKQQQHILEEPTAEALENPWQRPLLQHEANLEEARETTLRRLQARRRLQKPCCMFVQQHTLRHQQQMLEEAKESAASKTTVYR